MGGWGIGGIGIGIGKYESMKVLKCDKSVYLIRMGLLI